MEKQTNNFILGKNIKEYFLAIKNLLNHNENTKNDIKIPKTLYLSKTFQEVFNKEPSHEHFKFIDKDRIDEQSILNAISSKTSVIEISEEHSSTAIKMSIDHLINLSDLIMYYENNDSKYFQLCLAILVNLLLIFPNYSLSSSKFITYFNFIKDNSEIKKENSEIKKENSEIKKENSEIKKENLEEKKKNLLKSINSILFIIENCFELIFSEHKETYNDLVRELNTEITPIKSKIKELTDSSSFECLEIIDEDVNSTNYDFNFYSKDVLIKSLNFLKNQVNNYTNTKLISLNFIGKESDKIITEEDTKIYVSVKKTVLEIIKSKVFIEVLDKLFGTFEKINQIYCCIDKDQLIEYISLPSTVYGITPCFKKIFINNTFHDAYLNEQLRECVLVMIVLHEIIHLLRRLENVDTAYFEIKSPEVSFDGITVQEGGETFERFLLGVKLEKVYLDQAEYLTSLDNWNKSLDDFRLGYSNIVFKSKDCFNFFSTKQGYCLFELDRGYK